MTDLALNYAQSAVGTSAYGDLIIQNGDVVLTSDAPNATAKMYGTQPVTQAVLQACRTFLGECWLNTSIGIPYFQDILSQRGDDTLAFETALQDAILSVPGVQGLTAWNVQVQKQLRLVTVAFTAVTTDGIVSWSGNINPAAQGNS